MAFPLKIVSPNLYYLFIYCFFLLILFVNLPPDITLYYETRGTFIALNILGLWRYSWWMVHVIRSFIYTYWVFPAFRIKADSIWMSGFRPKQLVFMMTTYKEIASTTEKVLQSILCECHEVGVPTKIFIGTGCDYDEEIIDTFFRNQVTRIPLEIIMIRQNAPGKRFAIGDTLRSIVQNGLEADDPVIFMDGDTFLLPGCLRKCLPFFALFPKMQALTTFEQTIVHNAPTWMKKWLEMRFVQRDFTMRSYSLSHKVLTLTGRMSIFRGKHILEPEFIQIIEHDHLTHWLWGKYRFLSGDDKSTWYYLLRAGADMLYIPDATSVTIENINGNALDRMKENLRRWSGNTLRNGQRAIALGPRRVGFFIWWCLLDQRFSIWTMLIGHMIILLLSITKSSAFLMVAILWIGFSRLCMSFILFLYARRIDMSFPFLVYFNQLMTAIIKIYILFRLPQQRWKNRGDQSSGFLISKEWKFKNLVANYLTGFYCLSCLLIILLFLHIVSLPTLSDFMILLKN